jgi:hypothetical protein
VDKDTVKRAMELSGKGLTITQVSRQLGVNQKELRKAMSEYDDFPDAETEVAIIIPSTLDLGSAAYNLLTLLLQKMRSKADSPFTSMGELVSASALMYKIYSEENEKGTAGDSNDPVVRLFGDEIKLLK